MILGSAVPGLLTRGWRFVASDAHGIADKVREEFPEARLVAHEISSQLGVVNWWTPPSRIDAEKVEREAKLPVTAEGGMWLLVIRMHEPVTEEPICGEPDDRVLQECRRIDQKRKGPVNAKRYKAWAEHSYELQQERRLRQMEDEMGDQVERGWHQHVMANHGKYNRIFVPASMSNPRVH